jgi:hypothetical protein
VVGFTKELRVIGRDQVDDGPDLVLAGGRAEELAVVVIAVAADGTELSAEPPRHERLLVRSQPDAAAAIDEVGQKGIRRSRQVGFG